jgi:plasmid stability protein
MATLTLHDVPDELIHKLQERAREHGRSLVHEAVVCLESMVQPSPDPKTVAKAPQDAERASDPVLAAELAEFAEMRSWFKGPPIDEAELVAATERDSH